MSDSSEEEDYMSEAFLTKAYEADVRPGLVHSHKIARRMKVEEEQKRAEEEQKHRQKPIKQLEVERREEGLNSAITADNKGFSMLAKMGYKQGDAIGRNSNTGITEPIPIQVKTNRAGLGREAALKQLQEYKENLRRTKAQQNADGANQPSISQFRQRMAQKTNDKQIEADLCKCQRACEKLDLDASIEEPVMKFFWPTRVVAELAETIEDPYDEKSRVKPKRKRPKLVSSSSDDDDDDDSNMSGGKHKRFGTTLDSDDESSSESSDDDDDEEDEGRPKTAKIQEITTIDPNDDEDNEFETSEKLEMLTSYLRTMYSYCHWCGTHYDDATDMNSNCPGSTKDEH